MSMRKLFQTINKGEFETVKQIILRQPEVVNNKSVGLLKRDEGQTPLRIAVKNSFPKMTMLFVENDADLNAYTSEDDMYIIHQAIYTVIQYACSGKIHLRDREFKEKGIVSDYTQNLYDEDKQLFDISYYILEYLIKQGIDLSVKTKMGNCFSYGIILSSASFFPRTSIDDVPQEICRRVEKVFSLLLSTKVDTVLSDYVRKNYTLEKQDALEKWRKKVLSLCEKQYI